MSDTPGGPGWWLASDGKYYPPDTTPGTPSAATPTTSPPSKLARKPWWKRWWAIALAGFLILLVLGALFGEDPEKDPSDVATSNATHNSRNQAGADRPNYNHCLADESTFHLAPASDPSGDRKGGDWRGQRHGRAA